MRRSIAGGLAVTLAMLLGACSGTANSTANATADSSDSVSSTPGAELTDAPVQNGAMSNDGGAVYTTNCSSCHQISGTGVSGAFPPLAGNPVVTGDPAKLIHIVKYGLSGKVDVHGTTYDGTMPNWAGNLTDQQIAQVVTYVRASWGNRASAVSVSDVKAVSK